MDLSHVLDWNSSTFSGEVITSFIVMIIIAIFSFVIYFVFRKADPYKKANGFVAVISGLVEMVENYTISSMGKKWKNFTGYTMALGLYIFTCFFIGMTGLPAPLVSLTMPLSIGLMTFLLIHITAIRAKKWKYFKRYTEPFAIFLPVNLISMWAPLLSITLRLFGNAIAGYCLLTLAYFYLEKASSLLFSFIASGANQIFLAWLVTPWLHLFLDMFIGAIQTLIFTTITMIWVSQEDPDEEEVLTSTSVKIKA